MPAGRSPAGGTGRSVPGGRAIERGGLALHGHGSTPDRQRCPDATDQAWFLLRAADRGSAPLGGEFGS